MRKFFTISLSDFLLTIILFAVFCGVSKGQTTVFSDDFNSGGNDTWTTSGAIGATAWNVNRSGDDWGARRSSTNSRMEITNDVGGTANANGYCFANTLTSSFTAPYNTTLSSNAGTVTWSFNMRQIRTDPAGFGAGSYGAAFVLAANGTDVSSAGNADGYAIVLGQTGTSDYVRLVHFTDGIDGFVDIITGSVDFGANYLSIKVTYLPSTNTWELFVRDDGGAFADPLSGSPTSQGTVVNSTYTSSALNYLGCYWQGSTTATQTSFFDNVTVSVVGCAEPTTQATSFSTNTVTPTSMNIAFTRGNGDAGVMVVAKAGSAPTDPTSGTSYTANSTYGTGGTECGGGFVVYKGTASGTGVATGNLPVSGLSPETRYYFNVYEYNSSGTCYNLTELSGNRFTLSTEPSAHPASFTASGISISQINLSFSAASTISNADGYIILRRQDGANPDATNVNDGTAPGSLSLPGGTTLVTTIASTVTTTYNNTGLTANTQYYYAIIAYNADVTPNGETYNYYTVASVMVANASTMSNISDIIRNTGFSEPTNVSYSSYQETNLTSSSFEVAKFDIRDGGGVADADALGTTLTDITFSVTNWANIRRAAIYDGTTEKGEMAVSSGTVTFSGISGLTASDGTSKTFIIRVSFNSTVDDNEQFRFTVSSATADATGSVFATGSAGGAASSITGDANRIEVTADRLAFLQQPSNTGVNLTMSPAVSVQAVDVYSNLDLDFTQTIRITSSGSLSGTPVDVAAVSGVATFNSLVHTVAQLARQLIAERTGTLDWDVASFNFDITTATGTTLVPGDIMVLGLCSNTFTDCAIGANAGDDEISFVCFKDIVSGTTFEMTDNGWERLIANKWANSEGVVRATRTGGTITAGTVITFRFSAGNYVGFNPDASWTITEIHTQGTDLIMNTNGDQIFFMQGGTWYYGSGPNTHDATITSPNLLFGFNTNSSWTSLANSTQHSAMYPFLDCFSMMPNAGASDFLKYVGDFSATTQRVWIDRVNDPDNWATYAGCAAYYAGGPDYTNGYSISINTGGFSSGIWTGSRDQSWFNCGNWQNMRVPDSTVNVEFPSSGSSNDMVIGAPTGIYTKAQCNDLTLSSNPTYNSLINNAASILEIDGNFTNNDLLTNSNGVVRFVGSSAQGLGGSSSTTFYNLIINNTSATGVTLGVNTNLSSSGVLTFTDGELILNGYTLTINNTSTGGMTGASGSSYIKSEGESSIAKWVTTTNANDYIFPFGYSGTYIPFTFAKNTADAYDISISTFNTSDNNNTPLPATATLDAQIGIDYFVNRWWNITPSVQKSAELTFSFTAAEKSTVDITTAPVSFHWNGSNWDEISGTNSGNSITSTWTTYSPGGVGDQAAPLSIDLMDFSVRMKDNTADITWKTLSEKNNEMFTIEKSLNSTEFSKLIDVPGSGNSTTIEIYQVTDAEPFKDISYYRLKQTDYNKNFSYSKIIPLINVSKKTFELNSLKKSTYEITIEIKSEKNQFLFIDIFDNMGRNVYKNETPLVFENSTFSIPVTSIGKSGIYYLLLHSASDSIKRKFILE